MADPKAVRKRLVLLGAEPDDQGLAAIVGKLIDGGAIAADFVGRTGAQFRQIPPGTIGTNLSAADINLLLRTYAAKQGGDGRPALAESVPAPTPTAAPTTAPNTGTAPTTAGGDPLGLTAGFQSGQVAPAAGGLSSIRQAIEAFENSNVGADGNPLVRAIDVSDTGLVIFEDMVTGQQFQRQFTSSGALIDPDLLPSATAPRTFAPPSPGAGNAILSPGQTLVGPGGQILRALPPDPVFGETFRNEQTGEVFRTQNGQLVSVPELRGFPQIAPEHTFAEGIRQFDLTQGGLDRRAALAGIPGFLNAASNITEVQRSILNAGGDVVLRRFLAAGELPPEGLQTFTQADQLRGFNLPSLLNRFGGFTGALGFDTGGAQSFAAAPRRVVDSNFVETASGQPADTTVMVPVGTRFGPTTPEGITFTGPSGEGGFTTTATGFMTAEEINAQLRASDPAIEARAAARRLPKLAHGGVSRDKAIVGDSTDGRPNPELVEALPGGGFRATPIEGELPPDIRRAQEGGIFGFNRPEIFSFAVMPAGRQADVNAPLRLGAVGGQSTTSSPSDIERQVRERFLPGTGRGRVPIPRFEHGGTVSPTFQPSPLLASRQQELAILQQRGASPIVIGFVQRQIEALLEEEGRAFALQTVAHAPAPSLTQPATVTASTATPRGFDLNFAPTTTAAPNFGGLAGFFGTPPPDVTQGELQGFARETAFPNVRRTFLQGGRPPISDSFSFALPTLRSLRRFSPEDEENADTLLRLGAAGGKPTTFGAVKRGAEERFLPSQGRGRARLTGF